MLKRSQTNSSAKVVDGNLIITLPNAKNPIVWRMALGEARAAALEVVPRKDEYCLILKTAKGETTDIAPFDTRDQATDALMAVSRAMEGASGNIRPTATNTSTVQTGSASGWKWMVPLALILLALFFFTQTNRIIPETGYAASTTPSSTNSDIGVPMSADSYLGGM